MGKRLVKEFGFMNGSQWVSLIGRIIDRSTVSQQVSRCAGEKKPPWAIQPEGYCAGLRLHVIVGLMARISIQSELNSILKGVSRSFYLTLRILPAPVRTQLGIAYLFCRCADTIADTRLLPVEERLGHLESFRRQFEEDEFQPGVLEELVSRVGEPQEMISNSQYILMLRQLL